MLSQALLVICLSPSTRRFTTLVISPLVQVTSLSASSSRCNHRLGSPERFSDRTRKCIICDQRALLATGSAVTQGQRLLENYIQDVDSDTVIKAAPALPDRILNG